MSPDLSVDPIKVAIERLSWPLPDKTSTAAQNENRYPIYQALVDGVIVENAHNFLKLSL